MLDAVAVVFARQRGQRLLVGLQRHVEGAVADGVHAAAEAGLVAAQHGLVQLVLLDADESTVIRRVDVGFVEERVAAGDAAVDAHLRTAHPQPLVAEARLEAGLQHTVRAHVGLDDAQQEARAHVQAALRP